MKSLLKGFMREPEIKKEEPKEETKNKLELWKGPFGDSYRERNTITDEAMQSRVMQWSHNLNAISMYGSIKGLPKTILEVGCGGGINLLALERIYRNNGEMPTLYACEPNAETRRQANDKLREQNYFPIWLEDGADALDLKLPNHSVELVFTSGVLIHIHPDNQLKAMNEIYRVSQKYIICMEYFSPDLREIPYYSQHALWTRDYGSLWLDNFSVRAVACMFSWKRMSGLDNITIWIFEKVN